MRQAREVKSRRGKKEEGLVGPRRLGSLSSQDILGLVQQVIQGRNRTGRQPVVPVADLAIQSHQFDSVFCMSGTVGEE
ncbi:hypothetical protein E2C01_044437 [Portunus trituberculatus]|uniref:Uncharacterized protein n=1 Tax=Portunus trituberculatus TaxID=210409 RepID=A0A5B7G0G3_PORTR|nr:hypothetical protein [Portunus trituberculatus]